MVASLRMSWMRATSPNIVPGSMSPESTSTVSFKTLSYRLTVTAASPDNIKYMACALWSCLTICLPGGMKQKYVTAASCAFTF